MVTNNLLKILQFRADIVSQLQRAITAESFLKRALNIVNKLSFSDLDIMQVTTKVPYVNFIASSLPKSIFETYLQEAMYKHDIVPDVLMSATRPIHRSSIYEYIFNTPFPSFRFDENRAINELWSDYGFNDCYFLPIDLQGTGIKLVVSVLDKHVTRMEFKNKINEQRIKLNEFHVALNELLSHSKFLTPIKNKSNTLQKGDAEIIKAFCILGTAQQVANQLNLEVSTINNKITRIKKTLGASSIANAVYTSIKEGLIDA